MTLSLLLHECRAAPPPTSLEAHLHEVEDPADAEKDCHHSIVVDQSSELGLQFTSTIPVCLHTGGIIHLYNIIIIHIPCKFFPDVFFLK